MKNLQHGILIALEGIDGSGKTTLAQFLATQLMHAGYSVVLTKEPGGTEFGKQMRSIVQNRTTLLTPETEFLLFAADRAQHIHDVVKPALEKNCIVISDRMADSSLAYQGYGRGVDSAMIKNINHWVMAGTKPDLLLYIDLDVETAFNRIMQRKELLTDFEKEKKSFFERVVAGFEEIFKNRPEVIRLNGQHSAEDVGKQALTPILTFLASHE